MSLDCAIYFVVDPRLAAIALAIADKVNQLWSVDVHVFIEGLKPDEIRPTAPQPSIFCHFNELDPLLPDDLPEDEKWPRVVYARIFAPQLLRKYRKLLYLDADILPVASDHSIWNVAGEFALCAVRDFATPVVAAQVGLTETQWLNAIGVQSNAYFNSGVLLIDVNRWVQIEFGTKLVDYVTRYSQNMRFFDQDFLNFVFQERWGELSPRWNFQACFFNLDVDSYCEPLFIHFNKVEKPWLGQFSAGVEDTDKLGHDYLTALCASHGFDLAPFRRIKKINPLSRLKYFIRSKSSTLGLQSGKERRLRKAAERLRDSLFVHVSGAVASKRFYDGWSPHYSMGQRQPIFDGKTLRLPVSDAMRNLLRP